MSILRKVTRADVIAEPFPHVVVDEAVDPALYAQLAAAFPPGQIIVDGREVVNNANYHMRAARVFDDPRVARCWKEFAREHTSGEFFREVIAIFGDAIRALHPDLESRLGRRLEEMRTSVRDGEWRPSPGLRPPSPRERGEGASGVDFALDCQLTWGSPVTVASRSNACHVDRQVALYAGLLYCKLPEDDAIGGHLELFRFRGPARCYDAMRFVDDDLVEPVKRIEYAANRLVFFIHSPHSLHGVTTRGVTRWPRLHVNFLAEAKTNIFELEAAA